MMSLSFVHVKRDIQHKGTYRDLWLNLTLAMLLAFCSVAIFQGIEHLVYKVILGDGTRVMMYNDKRHKINWAQMSRFNQSNQLVETKPAGKSEVSALNHQIKVFPFKDDRSIHKLIGWRNKAEFKGRVTVKNHQVSRYLHTVKVNNKTANIGFLNQDSISTTTSDKTLVMPLAIIKEVDWQKQRDITPPNLTLLIEHYDIMAQLQKDSAFMAVVDDPYRLNQWVIEHQEVFDAHQCKAKNNSAFNQLLTYLCNNDSQTTGLHFTRGDHKLWLLVDWVVSFPFSGDFSYLIDMNFYQLLLHGDDVTNNILGSTYSSISYDYAQDVQQPSPFEHIKQRLAGCFYSDAVKIVDGIIFADKQYGHTLYSPWIRHCQIADLGYVFDCDDPSFQLCEKWTKAKDVDVKPLQDLSKFYSYKADVYFNSYDNFKAKTKDRAICITKDSQLAEHCEGEYQVKLVVTPETSLALAKIAQISLFLKAGGIFIIAVIAIFEFIALWSYVSSLSTQRKPLIGLMQAYGVTQQQIKPFFVFQTLFTWLLATVCYLVIVAALKLVFELKLIPMSTLFNFDKQWIIGMPLVLLAYLIVVDGVSAWATVRQQPIENINAKNSN